MIAASWRAGFGTSKGNKKRIRTSPHNSGSPEPGAWSWGPACLWGCQTRPVCARTSRRPAGCGSFRSSTGLWDPSAPLLENPARTGRSFHPAFSLRGGSHLKVAPPPFALKTRGRALKGFISSHSSHTMALQRELKAFFSGQELVQKQTSEGSSTVRERSQREFLLQIQIKTRKRLSWDVKITPQWWTAVSKTDQTVMKLTGEWGR